VVFAYHAAQPFVLTTWVVVDEEKSVLLSGLAGFGYLFGMPLMFLLAGAASWAALRRTAPAPYLRMRLRLVVPLVLGILLLGPIQAWIGSLTRGETASLPEFTASFWAGASIPTSPVWLGDYGYHLWFIGFLLVYAVLSVPLLLRLRSSDGPMRPTGLTLFVVPVAALVVTQIPLRIAFPAYRDWADFVLWFTYFLLGAAMLAWRPYLVAIGRHGLRMLVPGLALIALLVPLVAFGPGLELEAAPGYDAASIGYIALRTTLAWCLVLASLAIAARWFDLRPAEARTASGLVLPVYVLHHPVIVVVAAVVVGWDAAWWAKFPVILACSAAITLGVCLAIARTPMLRPLLGMSRGTPVDPAPEPAPAVAT
jgi:glucans biosynthesis protein C